jgi:DNA polymerase I
MEQEQFKVMRAWDKGHNKIRYVYHDENMRARIGETTFLNWFYVKTSDYDERRDVFTRLIEDKSLVKCENDGKYTRCYYNTVHESEFLTKDMEYDWGYKSFSKNKMLEKLDLLDIQTYEADVSASKRWLLQNNVTVEDDYKVLYYDIETDDRHGRDSLTPGKHRILSIAMKSSDNHNADGKMMWLYCHEDTDESECEFLQKVAKVFRAHDCIIAFNGSNFDDLYIKSRFARYGIEVDWRTKFLQDACWTFKKYGPNLPKHNLDYIGNYILKRGKVEHTGESIYGMWQNNLPLLKEYNIEDVQLMYDIECKTGYLNAHRGVCSVGMCPVDDLYILHKIDNFVLKQADEDKHYHFKTVVRKQDEEENEKTYEGAFVFDPIPGLHTDVKVLDFSSLYPNVINTFNISPDTFIEPDDLKSIPPEYVITTGTQHKFRSDYVGILPKVVMALKAKRDYWKEKMSHETPGTVMHKVYDRMQYLYKYFGLSFYGCLGEKHSRFYDTRIAEAVTLTGQMFTKSCARYVEKKHGARIIYGDTDSFFFHDDYFCQGHDRMEELSKELSKVCYHIAVKKNNCKVCTLKMSYDKGFKKYLILNGKKRYAGVIDYLDGHVINDFNMYIAGLEYKRTDTCKFVKEHQYELLKMILTDTPDAKTVRSYILKLKDMVCSGKLGLDEITFAQKLTKNVDEYADQIHVRVAREMIADGKGVYVGDKIPYFIISVGTDGKPIAKPVYKFAGKYSTQYYWNNKMFPPLQRILEVVYPKIDWESYLITGGKNVSFGRTNLW